MSSLTKIITIICALLAFSAIVVSQSPRPSKFDSEKVYSTQPLVITNVNLIPMNKNVVLKNRTVVVEKGKIVKIANSSSLRLPKNAQQIDGRNKFLMPGLVDFHVHLRDKSELFSYLAHGVTTVVHLSGAMGNVPDVIALRQEIIEGKVLGPNIYSTGRILDGNPPIFPNVSTIVSNPADAEQIVEEQFRAGVDFIKVYNNLTGETLQAVIKAAHKRGLAVIGHIPRKDGRQQALQTSLKAGQDMIAHSEEFFFTHFYKDTEAQLDKGMPPNIERAEIPQIVSLVKKSKAAVTPNLSFVAVTRQQLDDIEKIWSDPEIRFLHPNILSNWQSQNPTRRPDRVRFDLREKAKYPFLQDLVYALQSGGVLLLLGTDSSASGLFPGKSAHLELQELVKAKLTTFEALSTGTRNAGKFIKAKVRGAESFGTIAIGQRADLLLLEANPLESIENISQIVGVVVRGRWLSKAEIEKLRINNIGGNKYE